MSIKQRVKALANANSMSLPELEAKLGFGNGTIVRWDKSDPRADKIVKVADYFNVTVDYLLGRDADAEEFFNASSLQQVSDSQSCIETDSSISTCLSNIKTLFISSHMSFGKLSKLTGVSKSTLQRYISGSAPDKISLYVIEKIAAAFGVPPATLVGWASTVSDPPSIKEEPHCNQFSFTLKNGYTINGKITDSQLTSVLALLEIPGIGNVESDQSVK